MIRRDRSPKIDIENVSTYFSRQDIAVIVIPGFAVYQNEIVVGVAFVPEITEIESVIKLVEADFRGGRGAGTGIGILLFLALGEQSRYENRQGKACQQ